MLALLASQLSDMLLANIGHRFPGFPTFSHHDRTLDDANTIAVSGFHPLRTVNPTPECLYQNCTDLFLLLLLTRNKSPPNGKINK